MKEAIVQDEGSIPTDSFSHRFFAAKQASEIAQKITRPNTLYCLITTTTTSSGPVQQKMLVVHMYYYGVRKVGSTYSRTIFIDS